MRSVRCFPHIEKLSDWSVLTPYSAEPEKQNNSHEFNNTVDQLGYRTRGPEGLQPSLW